MDERQRIRMLFEARLRKLISQHITVQLVRNDVPMSFRGVVEGHEVTLPDGEKATEWAVLRERSESKVPIGYNAMSQPVGQKVEVQPRMRMWFSAAEVFAISEHLETEVEARNALGVDGDGDESLIARPPAGMVGGFGTGPGSYGR